MANKSNTQTTAKSTKEKADPDSDVLSEVMEKFNASRSYIKKGYLTTWKNARKLYNAQRIAVNYEGSSDTFVPQTFTIVQSVKSNVIGGKIKLDYMPTRDDQTGDIKVLNSMMEQIWVQDKTKLKASWAIDDSLQVGNGYLWQYWNGTIPCNIYIPTEDNWFDVSATNYDNLEAGGYRYLTTVDKLKAETITNPEYDPKDPNSEARVPRYSNLDKITTYSSTYKPSDKTAKQLREEMVAGSILATGEDKDDVVEVIVYLDKEKQILVANRCVVIENVDTPFKREKTMMNSVDDQGNKVSFELPEIAAFIPVAPARDYVDGAMWNARGEIEIIGDLQELLNDTQNQKTDNLGLANNMMATLDPSQAHKINEIQIGPGAIFTVPAGSLDFIRPTSIGADADIEMARIERMMQSATAASELVQGMGTVTSHMSSGAINAEIAQASARFASKLENYESEFFTILANNMFKVAQIFMTQEQAVRMIGQEGVEWKSYNPGEFLGDWDVKVSLEANAKAMREEEKQSAMQFYLMSSKLPFVNQEYLFKLTSEKLFSLDKSVLDKLIVQAPTPVPEKKLPSVSVSISGQDIGPQASQMLAMEAISNDPQAPQANGPMSGMPQAGAGAAASNPQGSAANQVSAGVQQSNGINVPGMPQG